MVLGKEISRYDSVRHLANVSINTYSNEKLKEIIETRGDGWVQTKTNKFDWVDTDKHFTQVISAADLQAAAFIRDGLPGADNSSKSEQQRVSARDIIKAINNKDIETSTNTTDPISVSIDPLEAIKPKNYKQQ